MPWFNFLQRKVNNVITPFQRLESYIDKKIPIPGDDNRVSDISELDIAKAALAETIRERIRYSPDEIQKITYVAYIINNDLEKGYLRNGKLVPRSNLFGSIGDYQDWKDNTYKSIFDRYYFKDFKDPIPSAIPSRLLTGSVFGFFRVRSSSLHDIIASFFNNTSINHTSQKQIKGYLKLS